MSPHTYTQVLKLSHHPQPDPYCTRLSAVLQQWESYTSSSCTLSPLSPQLLNYIHAHTNLAQYLVFVEWNLLALPYEEMHFCTLEELPPRPDQEVVATSLLEDPLRASTPMEVDNSTYRTVSQPLLPLSLPVTSCSAAKPSNRLSSKQPPPSSLFASKHPTTHKMMKREVHHKYPGAEDDLEEWNPPCLYCKLIKKPCFVHKDHCDRDSSGNHTIQSI